MPVKYVTHGRNIQGEENIINFPIFISKEMYKMYKIILIKIKLMLVACKYIYIINSVNLLDDCRCNI